jgi:hypothetical protein
MATPRQRPQTVAFVPQGTNQAKGSRSLPLGSLVEATNVRQLKEDEWRKRWGFARTSPSVDASVYVGPPVGAAYAGGALVERDAVGQFWASDEAVTTRRYRGSTVGARPFPTYQDAGITHSSSVVGQGPRRSVTVLGASSDRWVFTVCNGNFQRTITRSDGAVKLSASSTTSANVQQLAAVWDPVNSFMWVLALNAAGSTVTSYKYDSAGAFVSSATYSSPTGGTSLDAKWLSSPGEMAVVIAAYDSATPRCRVTQSYLNPSTGQPKGAPAAVNLDVTPHANRPDTCGGVRILISSGATTWYYSFWRASTNANTLDLILNSVTTSTLANAGSTVLTSVATTAGEDWLGVTSGYVDTGTGNRVVFAQPLKPDTTAVYVYDLATTRYTWDGAVTTTVTIGGWLASDPCLVGSTWYVVTGRDSGYYLTIPNSSGINERVGELYLRDSNGNIVSQILPGTAPPVWHQGATLSNDFATVQYFQYDQFVTNLLLIGSDKLVMTCGRTGELWPNSPPVVTTWNFSAGYGPPVALGNIAVFPGPVVLAAGPKDYFAELFPLHPPPAPRVAFGAAGASGVAGVCFTYRIVRSDGTAWETAPGPAITGTFFFNDNSVVIPPLKHQLGPSVTVQVCMYSTIAGGTLFTLQAVQENNTGASSLSFKIWPLTESFAQPAALHTNGGGLSNATPPPARCLTLWRDRLHLSGTPTDGEAWHSQEISEGLAPTFNEVLRSFWQDAQGPVLGLKAVDWNYLAGFKRNGIGVIGGPGPDGRGQGAYIWQTLTTEKGLSDTGLNSLLSTPFGAAFQNEADGRACLVSPGLQIQEIMQGADTSRTLTVGATVLNEPERQAWFYCTDGTLLVMEYAWAGETKNLVNCWRKWSSANLLRAYGAVMTPTGPLHIESNGVIRTQSANWVDTGSGASVDVLMALETGRMSPFGLMQEGGVVGAHVLGQHIGASSLRVTVTCDDGTPSVHNVTTSSPVDYSMKPAGGFRCKEVRVRIEETASGNEGFVFEGVALDVVPYGRTRILPVGQRIA